MGPPAADSVLVVVAQPPTPGAKQIRLPSLDGGHLDLLGFGAGYGGERTGGPVGRMPASRGLGDNPSPGRLLPSSHASRSSWRKRMAPPGRQKRWERAATTPPQDGFGAHAEQAGDRACGQERGSQAAFFHRSDAGEDFRVAIGCVATASFAMRKWSDPSQSVWPPPTGANAPGSDLPTLRPGARGLGSAAGTSAPGSLIWSRVLHCKRARAACARKIRRRQSATPMVSAVGATRRAADS
jgi:hypothetical protein